MKEIDARGLACPAPVLQTRAMLEAQQPAALRVRVDNAASQQNVQRFLESQGFQTQLAQEGPDFLVLGQCAAAAAQGAPQREMAEAPASKKILTLCATDRIGFGDDALGLKLMVNFIRTLKEMGPELWRLVLVNNGVKLAVTGSEVLTDLQALQAAGLAILVCGTCLTHFNLLEHKQVGQTTNMLDIVTAMQLADSVVSMG